MVNIFILIINRTKNLFRIIGKEDTSAIVSCTGDIANIPAGFLVGKILRIPFYVYVFDDFVFQWIGSLRLIAKFFAMLIFNRSKKVFGPNEFICEEYRKRYGVNAILVRNPCDKIALLLEPNQQWPMEKDKITILYTGAVYHANYDCFLNLIQAINYLSEYNLEFHIFSAQQENQLANLGINGKKVFIHPHLSYLESIEQQRRADILFLPLTFTSRIHEVIRTSAPGKMGDYLASARPILAHVPNDLYVSYYMKKYECGSVVDKNDPQKLAVEIRKLINQDLYREKITKNAKYQAYKDFSPKENSSVLFTHLNILSNS